MAEEITKNRLCRCANASMLLVRFLDDIQHMAETKQKIPFSNFHTIANGIHFEFIPNCKPNAQEEEQIVKELSKLENAIGNENREAIITSTVALRNKIIDIIAGCKILE